MTLRSRVVVWLVASVSVLLPAAIQFQNFFWSTARVENRSGRPLSQLSIVLNSSSVEIGVLPAETSRFVRLPKKGDSIVRVRFSAGGGHFTQCQEFVRSVLYHVRVVIAPNLMAECHTETDSFLQRVMLLEMMP